MCNWISVISDGKGKMYYFNQEQREQIRKKELKAGRNIIENPDSHSSISTFYNLDDDKVNKYEFRPLDRKFIIDQINTTNDQDKINRKVIKLDCSKLAPPELIFKKIIHPFKDRKALRVTKEDIALLKEWDSVSDSVKDSVWYSVSDSVWYSVRSSVRISVSDSVWDSVKDSVWDSVRNSVRNSVSDSVWDSVKVSVWYSVRNSVLAYTSSFLNLKKWKYIKHKKGKNPFQSCIDLWERGIVPAFDGKNWYLIGYKGKTLKTIPKEKLCG